LLDRERLLAKIDVLDRYLKELREILPASIEEYKKIEKRRACERLLQVSVECVIDICGLLVIGLRLGLPAYAACNIHTHSPQQFRVFYSPD
jgi:uncharacterized protein YutE (UPF0331/DUF86 family)